MTLPLPPDPDRASARDTSAPEPAGANSPTTIDLLRRLRAPTDEPAWREFDARYRPLAMAVARRLGLNGADLEDVAQQAMLEFFRGWSLGEYDMHRGRLRTWLVAIVRHRGIDLLRRSDRRRAWRGDSAIDHAVGPEELESAWDTEARRLILADALDRLRATSRAEPRTFEAFDRFALQGVPAEAVAAEQQMSIADVYRIKSRFLKQLRAIIDDLERTWSDGIGSPVE